MAKRILMAVTAVMTLLVGSTAATAQVQQAPDYRDEFDGTALGAGWTFRDGYADQLPADTANHASYAVAGGALTISIPGGAEHNQWWLRHAEIQRPYEGSGVYETRIDSQFTGSQQVGLSFETAPGTFMQFMLYGRGTVRGFVERFVTHEGTLHKDTVTGFNTGIGIPTTNAGSWYLRVTLDDDADPTLRSWNFEWSTDGSNWNAGVSGVYETADPTENVGAIQQVGVFAGNHRTGYDAYDANVAYFSVSEEPPVNPPAAPVVQATGTSSSIALSWDDELATDTYRVERATANDGPFTAIVTGHPDPAYTDTAVTAGSTYFYRVVAVRGGVEGVASGVVSASLVGGPPDPPDGVPLDGLVLALDASALSLADGDPVSVWADGSGVGGDAVASGSARPGFVSSGIGGLPSVRFDGSDDYLDLTGGFEDFTAGLSMYVVASPSVLQSGFKLVALGNGAGRENVVLGRAGSGSGLQYFTTSSARRFGWFNTGPALFAGEASVYSVVQSGGAVDDRVTASVARDGVVVGSGQVYVPPVAVRGSSRLGRSFWNEGWFQGDVAEVLVYDRELSAAEQAQVSAYLATKYGLP